MGDKMLKVIENLQIEQTLIRLIKEEESSQKGKETHGVSEVFRLMDIRFKIINNYLEELKKELSKEIIINDIYLKKTFDNEIMLVIQYKEDDSIDELVISCDDYPDLDFSYNTSKQKHIDLLEKNKELISLIFEKLFLYNFDQRIEIPSSSRLFKISSDLEGKSLFDVQNKWLHVNFPYQKDEMESLIPPVKNLEVYQERDKMVSILDHFRIYDEDIPQYLKKIK